MPEHFTPLPADLPEAWTPGQIISPGGTEVGLTKQHGYNYLNKSVNDAQKAINQVYAYIDSAIFGTPYQTGTLTYNGEVQSPQWSGYDPTKMNIGGQTSGTNAGMYIATFTPKPGNTWSDGSADSREVQWSIGKAEGSLSISPTILSMSVGDSKTISVTRDGNGAISASSDNNTVATVSVAENIVTVYAAGTGSATITVSVAEDSNYITPSPVACSVESSSPVYGARWDGTSTPKWTRTGAAATFSDPVPYVDGASSYGSPFDNILPWSGMVKSERSGGTMVAIPKFYYTLTQQGQGMEIQISESPFPGSYVSPAHMDRGDGKGERNVVYVGRYHSASATVNRKSLTNSEIGISIPRRTGRSQVKTYLGANYWMCDFLTRFTIQLLYIVEFADWDSQRRIGRGRGNSSYTEKTGYTDSMPYHTGTTKGSRLDYGCGTQYRNIEGLWDNVYDWCEGCYNSSDGFNVIINPNNFSDTNNGVVVGVPSSGYPSGFQVYSVPNFGFPVFLPSKSGGSNATYSCDLYSYSNTVPCIIVGGNYAENLDSGMFYYGCYGLDNYNNYTGLRLMELP